MPRARCGRGGVAAAQSGDGYAAKSAHALEARAAGGVWRVRVLWVLVRGREQRR